jgi:hypothetical protein
MRTSTRLAGFAAIVAAVFALGWGIGAAVGPVEDDPIAPPPAVTTTVDLHTDHEAGPPPGDAAAAPSSAPTHADAGGERP